MKRIAPWHRLPRSAGIIQIASSTIRRDILLWPTRRSVNTIGISTTRKPELQRAIGELDLEGVALGADPAQVERLQHLAPEALEAAGQVAHRQAEHRRARTSSRRGSRAGASGPSSGCRRRGTYARPEHEVRVARCVDHLA